MKCSGNWMWPAKMPGEGAALYDACRAMCDVMTQLGVAIDGGKDSLSMAARVGSETVKAPGDLVVSVYAGCPDITGITIFYNGWKFFLCGCNTPYETYL